MLAKVSGKAVPSAMSVIALSVSCQRIKVINRFP
jgi:hypothetical protein